MKNLLLLLIMAFTCNVYAQKAPKQYHPQPFVHPGISQSRADLELMKKKVLSNDEFLKPAFDRLIRNSENFKPRPFTHVVRGASGSNSSGGSELSSSANQAYSAALAWYITGDKRYANKSIEILNAWSGRLWDFDDNDAKLLAGWTGHLFCNAAEILKYTNSGWQKKDIVQFKKMLMAVYYPLTKNFFPEANGNWDAAMMHTQLAMAIFCDDHAMFDKVVDHYLYGEGNSGLTKYVYPSGQCEESARDMNHTQLGLGELAQTCKIAWTQGVDLYSAADNRLALGYEYTGKYMFGGEVPVYGIISPNGRGRFSDVYQDIYQHYHDIKGLDMPYTRRAADTTKRRSSVMLLSAVRAPLPGARNHKSFIAVKPSAIAAQTGAQSEAGSMSAGRFYHSLTGADLQMMLDSCAQTGGTVLLNKGLYTLPGTLRIGSGTTLAGQGKETILFLDPKSKDVRNEGAAIINNVDDLHDVVLRDLVVEGATTPKTTTDPNQDRRQRSYQNALTREGVVFEAQFDGQMKNIQLMHITVRNCTKSGVVIAGAAQVTISGCDFSDNGASVVPGPGLHQNLYIFHVQDCTVSDSRMDTSPWGNGVKIAQSDKVTLTGNELARNHLNGIAVFDSKNITISQSLLEGNDANGILFDAQATGNAVAAINHNISRYNGLKAINVLKTKDALVSKNSFGNNRVASVGYRK